jgi:cell division protein FtsB
MVAKRFKKEKQYFQNIFFSLLLIVLFSGIIIFIIISNIRISQKRTELTARIESLKKEIQVLEEKNKELKAGISQSQEEAYWEEKIREQGYKKPGEEVTVVLPPPKSEEEKPKEKSLWQKIWEKLNF